MSNTESKLALPPGTVLFQYVLQEVVGHGGFGIVYRALHKSLNIEVAIKEYLPKDLVERDEGTVHPLGSEHANYFEEGLKEFLDEAKHLVKFDDHPHVIKCRDYFEANGTAYLVMNFEEGAELSEILKAWQQKNIPLNERQVLKIIRPVLEGLAGIHAAGVLHRDIKPSNIFIRRETEQPVLIDFGAAKTNFNEEKSKRIGTQGYSPSEQMTEIGDLGPWSDLYAVGAMMWRILTNELPTDSVIRETALYKGMADPMTPAVEVGQGKFSQAFLEAIDRSLRLDIGERFQSAEEFLAALPDFDGSNQYVAEPITRHYNFDKQQKTIVSPLKSSAISQSGVTSAPVSSPPRPKYYLAAIAAVVLLVGGTSLIIMDRGNDTETSNTVTAETAQLDSDVVFSKFERMYEHGRQARIDQEQITAKEITVRQFEIIYKDALNSGDTADAEDTLSQIQYYNADIQSYQLKVRESHRERVNVAFDLALSYRESGDYMDDLMQQKLDMEGANGNVDKSNLLNGYFQVIKEASARQDQDLIRQYLEESLSAQ